MKLGNRCLIAGVLVLLVVPVSAQLSTSPGRTVGVPAPFQETAVEYESLLARRDVWYRNALDDLYALYSSAVTGRERASDYETDLAGLLQRVRTERQELDFALEARAAELSALVQVDSPLPGTPDAASLFDWVASQPERSRLRSEMALLLFSAELDQVSPEEQERFAGVVAQTLLPLEPVTDASRPPSPRSLTELLSVRLLLSPQAELSALVDATGNALAELGTVGTRVATELEQLQLASRVEARLTREPLSAAALAALRPSLFAEREPADSRWREQAAALGATLALFGQSSQALLHSRAADDPAVAFALERSDSLLLRATFRERARFAARTGLTRSTTDALLQSLYGARSYVEDASVLLRLRDTRMDPALRLGETLLPPAADATVPSVRFFEQFLELGAENAELVAAVEASSEPRSGDDYRWNMLAALSHPFTLHLLATEARYTAAARLLDEFVARVYRETVARSGVRTPATAAREQTGLGRYDHTIFVSSDAEAGALYASFVQAAQGLDDLPESYLGEYSPGISQAEHWAHIHGFHVVVTGPTLRGTDLLSERAARWFELATLAEIPDERFGHQVRGFAALADVAAQTRDALAATRTGSLAAAAPALSVAAVWAARVTAFDASSAPAAEVVQRLFGWHSRGQIAAAFTRAEQRFLASLRGIEAANEIDSAAFADARAEEQ